MAERLTISRLYTPRSGSKIIARGSGTGIADTDFASHVLVHAGPVVRVWSCGNPSWRQEGRDALTSLVAIVGGAAADVRGELCYYAPSKLAAGAVARVLATIATGSAKQDLLLQAALATGCLAECHPLEDLRGAVGEWGDDSARHAEAESHARAWSQARAEKRARQRAQDEFHQWCCAQWPACDLLATEDAARGEALLAGHPVVWYDRGLNGLVVARPDGSTVWMSAAASREDILETVKAEMDAAGAQAGGGA